MLHDRSRLPRQRPLRQGRHLLLEDQAEALGVGMIRRFVKAVLRESSALAWTVGGVGLVLITMSGRTLEWGLWIAGASLFAHLVGVMLSDD